MSCHQFDDAILELARGAPAPTSLRAHLAGCARCSAHLRQQQNLTRGLRALAAATEHARPSARLDERVMGAFLERVEAQPRLSWRSVLGAAAAVVLVVASMWLAGRDLERAAQHRRVAAEHAFVPWPGAGALPAFESGALLRTELPVSVLPLLGLEPASGITTDTVMADVLIAQDGLARAVRLAE